MTTSLWVIPGLAMLSREQGEQVRRSALENLHCTGVGVSHRGAVELLRHTDAVLAGHSNNCATDEQAAAAATFSGLAALLPGTNVVHDVGYLEAGLTSAPDMVLFTAETISMLRRFMARILFEAEDLDQEVMDAVESGGDFLTQRHMLKHFRELWQPTLFDRRCQEEWAVAGRPRLGQRLREKMLAILDGREPESLPDGTRQIDAILRAQPARGGRK